jgi:hypothetical protein
MNIEDLLCITIILIFVICFIEEITEVIYQRLGKQFNLRKYILSSIVYIRNIISYNSTKPLTKQDSNFNRELDIILEEMNTKYNLILPDSYNYKVISYIPFKSWIHSQALSLVNNLDKKINKKLKLSKIRNIIIKKSNNSYLIDYTIYINIDNKIHNIRVRNLYISPIENYLISVSRDNTLIE